MHLVLQILIGRSLLKSLLTFLHHKHTTLRREGILLQNFKELVKLNNPQNSQFFTCNIEGNVSFQKLQNFEISNPFQTKKYLDSNS